MALEMLGVAVPDPSPSEPDPQRCPVTAPDEPLTAGDLMNCNAKDIRDDLALWAAGRGKTGTPVPRTRDFQEKYREPWGREIVQCLMAQGVCPFQRPGETSDGKQVIVCAEPHGVPTE